MSAVEVFLAGLGPALLDLGRELFRKHGGSSVKARREIRSRIAELRAEQAKIDAAAERKFRGR